MKKIIYFLSILTLLTGILLFGCEATQKDNEENKTTDVVVIKEADSDNATVVVIKATPEEWRLFKLESEQKINDNQARIAELKRKLNKPGKMFDKMYANKINRLEEQNAALRLRIVTYEETQTDWQKFKEEFNHDMDELGKALRDITVDNKQ